MSVRVRMGQAQNLPCSRNHSHAGVGVTLNPLSLVQAGSTVTWIESSELAIPQSIFTNSPKA